MTLVDKRGTLLFSDVIIIRWTTFNTVPQYNYVITEECDSSLWIIAGQCNTVIFTSFFSPFWKPNPVSFQSARWLTHWHAGIKPVTLCLLWTTRPTHSRPTVSNRDSYTLKSLLTFLLHVTNTLLASCFTALGPLHLCSKDVFTPMRGCWPSSL